MARDMLWQAPPLNNCPLENQEPRVYLRGWAPRGWLMSSIWWQAPPMLRSLENQELSLCKRQGTENRHSPQTNVTPQAPDPPSRSVAQALAAHKRLAKAAPIAARYPATDAPPLAGLCLGGQRHHRSQKTSGRGRPEKQMQQLPEVEEHRKALPFQERQRGHGDNLATRAVSQASPGHPSRCPLVPDLPRALAVLPVPRALRGGHFLTVPCEAAVVPRPSMATRCWRCAVAEVARSSIHCATSRPCKVPSSFLKLRRSVSLSNAVPQKCAPYCRS